MAIYDVTQLNVYQRALSDLRLVYGLANRLPMTHIKLKKQIIESAESIPPLIAEGFGKRNSANEFKRFLRMAMGSADETITHSREIYLLAEIYRLIDKNICLKVEDEYKIIAKQLNKLIKNWVDYTR